MTPRPDRFADAVQPGAAPLDPRFLEGAREISRDGNDLVVHYRDGSMRVIEGFFDAAMAIDWSLSAALAIEFEAALVGLSTGNGEAATLVAQASGPLPAAGAAPDTAIIARVVSTTGEVQIQRGQTTISLRPGDGLREGDVIQTGGGGELRFELLSRSESPTGSGAVGENAKITVGRQGGVEAATASAAGAQIGAPAFKVDAGAIVFDRLADSAPAVQVITPAGAVLTQRQSVGISVNSQSGETTVMSLGAQGGAASQAPTGPAVVVQTPGAPATGLSVPAEGLVLSATGGGTAGTAAGTASSAQVTPITRLMSSPGGAGGADAAAAPAAASAASSSSSGFASSASSVASAGQTAAGAPAAGPGAGPGSAPISNSNTSFSGNAGAAPISSGNGTPSGQPTPLSSGPAIGGGTSSAPPPLPTPVAPPAPPPVVRPPVVTPGVSLSAVASVVEEQSREIAVEVRLSTPTTEQVTLDLLVTGTSDGRVASGSIRVVLDPGTTVSRQAIPIKPSTVRDADATVDFTIANLVNGVSGGASSVSVKVVDEQPIFGGAASDRVVGAAKPDTLDGGDGDDVVDGGGGNDVLLGGAGQDTLEGGEGNDSLSGGDGSDSLTGDEGDDTLTAGAGNDTVQGGIGNDSIDGGADAGDDSLAGDEGDDRIAAGAGNDTVSGGTGDDVLSGDAGDDTLTAGAGNDTVQGGTGNDSIDGGADAGDDSLAGDEGDDRITAGAGNDTVSGGTGNDVLSGDAGDDTLTAGAGNDTVRGGIGNDSIDGGADAGDDSLAGDEGDDRIAAGAGNDTVSGGTGDDVLSGDAGDDTLTAGAGNDTVQGGIGNDSIDGGADAGDDSLAGDEGDDRITAGAGNDTVSGGTGNDTLEAGDGSDVLAGGAGRDVDGITSEVETILASRARGITALVAQPYVLKVANLVSGGSGTQLQVDPVLFGDLNQDSVPDAEQNTVTTFAWINSVYYDQANSNPRSLSTTAPIVSLVAENSAQSFQLPSPQLQLRNVVSTALTLQQDRLLDEMFDFTPNWSPMGFTAELRANEIAAGRTTFDSNPNRTGDQWHFTVDISRTGETVKTFVQFLKWIDQPTINAYSTAGLPLIDLTGKPITQVGWYDFTRKAGESGDGVAIGSGDGGNILFLDYVITDNKFGDSDPTVGRIVDPGMPVFINYRDDNRPVTITSPVVNEASPYAVFTVSGSPSQILTLSLEGGTATPRGVDFGTASGSSLEVSVDGGITWRVYSGGEVTLSENGTMLVRTPVINDVVFDNGETFNLVATTTGGNRSSGTATLRDDGSGAVFNERGVNDPAAIRDDDTPRPIILPPVIVAPRPPAATAIVVPDVPAPVIQRPAFDSAVKPTPANPLAPITQAAIGEIYTSSSGFRTAVIDAPQPALVLFKGITDQFVQNNRPTSFALPADAFAHTRAEAVISVEAKQSNGAALPAWMQFNAQAGTFSAVPPAGFAGQIEISVVARDSEGREAVATFKLNVGQGAVQPTAPTETPASPQAPAAPVPAGRSSLSEQLRAAAFQPGRRGFGAWVATDPAVESVGGAEESISAPPADLVDALPEVTPVAAAPVGLLARLIGH